MIDAAMMLERSSEKISGIAEIRCGRVQLIATVISDTGR